MAKVNLNEQTWQLAALRAGLKAVQTGLRIEDAPAETLRRARDYVRRLRGVTPAERAKRVADYAYWFLDTVYEGCYWQAYDAADDTSPVSRAWQAMHRAHDAGDIAAYLRQIAA